MKISSQWHRALFALLIVLTPSFASAQETHDIEERGREFYARFADGDRNAFTSLWAAGHLSATTSSNAVSVWRAKCLIVRSLAIDTAKVTADAADLTMTVVLEKQDRRTGQRFVDLQHPMLHYIREGSEWRVAEWRMREEGLATKLAAAHSAAEAQQLLDAEPELIDLRLVQSLSDRIYQLSNRGEREGVERASNLLSSIAATVGEPGAKSLALAIESLALRIRPQPDLEGAVARSQESVTLAEQSGNADLLALALMSLVRAYDFRDQTDVNSAPLYKRIFDLGDRVEEQGAVWHSAIMLGEFEAGHGSLRRALEWCETAKRIIDPATAKMTAFALETTLGDIYSYEEDFELASRHFRAAIDKAAEIHFRNGHVMTLGYLANSYQRLGRQSEFRKTADEAIAEARTTGQPEIVASILTQIGLDDIDRDDLPAADIALTEAAAQAEKGPDAVITADALDALGLLRLKQKRFREAVDTANRAAELETKTDNAKRFDAWVIAAKAYRALGDRDSAVRKLREAVGLAEMGRMRLGGGERQSRLFFKAKAPAYTELVDLLVERGDVTDALTMAERAKGRTLHDILDSNAPRVDSLLSPDERERERQLDLAIAAANRALLDARATHRTSAQIATDESDLAQRRLDLEAFRAALYTNHPKLEAQRTGAQPLSADQLSASVPPGAAVVEYVVTEKRLQIFVASRDGKAPATITVATVEIPQSKLDKLVAQFASRIAQRDLDYAESARALDRILLQPVMKRIGHARAICVIPDGSLWTMPFEALLGSDHRFAIERLPPMFYAPSLSVLREMTARTGSPRSATNEFLGCAGPANDPSTSAAGRIDDGAPLHDSVREVRQIASLFDPAENRVYIGAEASESRIKQEIGAYHILHFATHGVLDDHDPLYSYLVLARSGANAHDDGLLEAWEMMQLDLHADLAVLSACETARGSVDAGEGLVGITWALFAAGCPAAIASEWRVDSRATSQLMVTYYRDWLTGKHDTFGKARALRAARLSLLHDHRYRHPYYWSTFVLIGNPH